MDIKAKLRIALLEGAHKNKQGNKFGCVMVFLGYVKSEWDEMQDLIDDEDLYEPKGESGYGKETEPHITILYGLHNDIPDSDIKEEIDLLKVPKLKLGKVSSFSNDKFDVLKFDVESKDLHAANKKFTKFPFTSDYPKYHPHCTIAYVKKGLADKYIDKLNKASEVDVTSDKIVYSKADGTKKHFKFK